jgi:hypothetical protein
VYSLMANWRDSTANWPRTQGAHGSPRLLRVRSQLIPELALTRFRGHLNLIEGGLHNAKSKTAIFAGVPGADGRAGARGPQSRGAVVAGARRGPTLKSFMASPRPMSESQMNNFSAAD